MKTLGEIADAITKVGVPVAVFRYLALRAHLNRIGIPSTSGLGFERYLAETFLLVTSLLLPVGVIIATLSVIVIPGRVLWRAFVKRNEIARFAEISERRRDWLLVFVLLAAYLALIVRVATAWPHMDIAVGDLIADRLNGPSGWPTLLGLVAVSVVGVASLRSEEDPVTRSSHVNSLPRRLAMAMLLILVVHVPLVFGWAVRPAQYPVVRVDLRDPAESACGLLVIETDADLRMWRGESRHGEVLRLPRSRAIRIVAGPVHDLLDDARHAVTGQTAPVCP